VNEKSCIYRLIFQWIWAEKLGLFPKPPVRKQQNIVFSQMGKCAAREARLLACSALNIAFSTLFFTLGVRRDGERERESGGGREGESTMMFF